MRFGIKSKKVDIYEILCNFEVLAQHLNKLDIVDKATTSDHKLNHRDEFNTQLKDVMLESGPVFICFIILKHICMYTLLLAYTHISIKKNILE